MFDELIKQIEQLLLKKPHVVVAISGFAGSGKSSLADRLRDHLNINGGQIIRLDNLYTPLPRGDGLFDDYNWPLLTRILQEVHEGKDLNYQGTGFDGKAYDWQFKEKLPQVVIVEGIRLFRPELMNNFDLSVWIDCPPELALKRAKARDLSQGNDEAYMKRWDTEWGPQNQEYFDTYCPDQLADFIYKEYK